MNSRLTLAGREQRIARRDALLLGAFALALRLPALLAHRHHHPDDGNFGLSAVAMRGGSLPFRDLFSSQGPLHLPLVFLGDLPRTYWSPRSAATLAGIAITVLVYAIGRRLSSRPAAVLAAVLVTTSGSILWTTGPITSDGPTLAFVCAAFLLALRIEAAPSAPLAIALGLVSGAGLLVKPAIALLGVLPSAWLLARTRRWREILYACGSALALGLLACVPFGLSTVWDQAVTFQLDSKRQQSQSANLHKVVDTLLDRDLAVVIALAVALVGTLILKARGESSATRSTGTTPVLLVWALPTFAFLVLEPALWRNHLAALIVPLVLIAITRPVPVRWLVVATVVAAPFQIAHLDDILQPPRYREDERAALAALRALPPGSEVLSDETGLVWQAGLVAPDGFTDISIKQIEQRRITTRRLVDEASRDDVCAVLVWYPRTFGALPSLAEGLADFGYQATRRFGSEASGRVLYTRSTCSTTQGVTPAEAVEGA